jgi:hypothetical protein
MVNEYIDAITHVAEFLAALLALLWELEAKQ